MGEAARVGGWAPKDWGLMESPSAAAIRSLGERSKELYASGGKPCKAGGRCCGPGSAGARCRSITVLVGPRPTVEPPAAAG